MKSLIISTKWELTDARSEDILADYKDIEIYKNIIRIIPGSWLVDRTNTIQLPFHNTLLESNRIPELENVATMSLMDCILNRVTQLKSQNIKINFLWSGGIDSTAALVGFLTAGIEKDRLNIICNQDSLKENYQFYKNNIREKFKITSSEKFVQDLKYNSVTGITVNSEHGDLLYGQDFGQSMFKVFGSEFLTRPVTKENIKQFFIYNGMTDESAECWYDLFHTLQKHSPRPLHTMYDWSWWIGYNWRWQWAREKFKLRFPHDIKFDTFFGTPEMQKWSVNHKQRTIEKLSDFKFEMKEIIKDYDNNLEYFQHKIKYVSRSFTYYSNAAAAIDGNGKKIMPGDFKIMDFYNPNNFISEWLKAQ